MNVEIFISGIGNSICDVKKLQGNISSCITNPVRLAYRDDLKEFMCVGCDCSKCNYTPKKNPIAFSTMYHGTAKKSEKESIIKLTHHAECLYENVDVEHIHVEVCIDGEWYGGDDHKMFAEPIGLDFKLKNAIKNKFDDEVTCTEKFIVTKTGKIRRKIYFAGKLITNEYATINGKTRMSRFELDLITDKNADEMPHLAEYDTIDDAIAVADKIVDDAVKKIQKKLKNDPKKWIDYTRKNTVIDPDFENFEVYHFVKFLPAIVIGRTLYGGTLTYKRLREEEKGNESDCTYVEVLSARYNRLLQFS